MKSTKIASLGVLSLILFSGIVTQTSAFEKFSTKNKPQIERINQERENFKNLINRTTENLSNGVKITVSTNDAKALEHLHQQVERMNEKSPKNEDITHVIDKTATGFIMSITSSDTEKVEKIQTRSNEGAPFGDRKITNKKHGDRKSEQKFKDVIEKTVTNTSNGVQITFITSDAEALEHLYEKAEKMTERKPMQADVTQTVSKDQTGITVVISTTDTAKIEKIQVHALEEKGIGERKKGKKGAMRAMRTMEQ